MAYFPDLLVRLALLALLS